MMEAIERVVVVVCMLLAVVLLSRIYSVLQTAATISAQVNVSMVEQLKKPMHVTIDQEHPVTVSIDNDVLQMKVQK
jgi:hypothetical protein